MQHKEPREPISAEDAAAVLGCSRQMVYLLVQQGAIAAFRVGRRVVLDRAAVLAFIEQHRVRV